MKHLFFLPEDAVTHKIKFAFFQFTIDIQETDFPCTRDWLNESFLVIDSLKRLVQFDSLKKNYSRGAIQQE